MLCPRCHRPIEGPEEYICCAGEPLEWRCRDCGKVSEGFAFPYGLCPLCNGRLEMLGAREIEDDASLDAVRIAFEIELGGQAFYSQAALDASEPELKALFGSLAEMESEHMETLARRYRTSIPEPSECSGVERAALFAGVENKPDDPANLFRIAIACEERAAAFFADKCKDSADGSPEQQMYKELAAEEREHADLLSTELERWQAGKPGLL